MKASFTSLLLLVSLSLPFSIQAQPQDIQQAIAVQADAANGNINSQNLQPVTDLIQIPVRMTPARRIVPLTRSDSTEVKLVGPMRPFAANRGHIIDPGQPARDPAEELLRENFDGWLWPAGTDWDLRWDGNIGWDDENARHHGNHDNYAMWCAGRVSNPANNERYDNDGDAVAIWGPIDMSDPTREVVLSFWQYYQTEANADWCDVLISTNPEQWNTRLERFSGNSNGWVEQTYHLENAGNNHQFLGQEAVYICFWFSSNAQNQNIGWWVDEVVINRIYGNPNITVNVNHDLPFDDILVGQDGPEDISITNDGNYTLTVTNITKDGNDQGNFTIQDPNGFTVAPGASVNRRVTFRPAARRNYSARLQINCNSPGEEDFVINMTGTGIAPVIVTNPADLLEWRDPVRVGQSQNLPVRVTNDGDTRLTVQRPEITSGNPPFAVVNAQGFQLNPGNSADIIVSFTPEASGDFRGNLRITSDDAVTPQKNITLVATGIANHAPVIDQPGGGNAVNLEGPYYEDREVRVQFHANDQDGDALTWTISDNGNLPQGARNMTAAGIYTWNRPDFTQAGNYHFTARVTDNGQPENMSDGIVVNFTVGNVNRPPEIDQPSAQTPYNDQAEHLEDREIRYQFRANDQDNGDVLTWSFQDRGNLPQNGPNLTAQGLFTWTPGFGDAGQYHFTARVTDNGQPQNMFDDIVVNFTVGNVNRPPEIDQPSAQTPYNDQAEHLEDREIRYQFHANDPDNGDALTWTFQDRGNLPQNGPNLTAQGLFTWTPDFTQAGNYHFTARVTDNGQPGNLFDDIVVNFIVTNVNRPPEIDQPSAQTPYNDQAEHLEDREIRYQFHANDPDNGDALTWTFQDRGNLPQNGPNLTEQGLFTWTPDFTQAGNYHFTARVTDNGQPGNLFDEIVVNFVVTDVNDVKINEQNLPEVLALHSAYPNPFNAVTHVSYDIPEPTMVSLKVIDITGKEVATLAHGEHTPNRYAVSWDANGLQGGIYFIRLQTAQGVLTSKVVLVK